MLDDNTAWIKKYQPKTIDDYVFANEKYRTLITKWYENEKIDGNLILYGPPGTGKTSLIRVLVNKIIKSKTDLYTVNSRSVDEVDEIRQWINKRPTRSKQNIVYFEEIDQISKAAQTGLKDKLMENFVETCVFLCATNHPKRLNPALLDRFTYQFHLNTSNKDDLFKKIKFILDNEKCEYNENSLLEYVDKNYEVGLRTIINTLQIEYVVNDKKILFDEINDKSEIEEHIIDLFFNMIKCVIELSDNKSKKLCLIYPKDSAISNDYINFITILNNNWNIDYNYIFEELIEKINIYPCKKILVDYYETLENKKYSHYHLIGCFYDLIKSTVEMMP